jgi:glycosyltransferase involved in cell wall biosynthesis
VDSRLRRDFGRSYKGAVSDGEHVDRWVEPLLSVVMPVFNERATVMNAIAAVRAAPVQSLELIVVDDCSDDGTRELLTQGLEGVAGVSLVLHDQNRGKGAALRSGFARARGRFVLIQDADNEYNPTDYPTLLKPLLDDRADVVFGSRFLGGPHRVLYYWHSVANGILTRISNMITDLNLTDMETCYKVFRREVLEKLDLREDRFGIEPEMTAKVAQLGVRIYEVPISYNGRTYAEGKKIGMKDAFRAVYCIVRYGVKARYDRGVAERSAAEVTARKR